MGKEIEISWATKVEFLGQGKWNFLGNKKKCLGKELELLGQGIKIAWARKTRLLGQEKRDCLGKKKKEWSQETKLLTTKKTSKLCIPVMT
ncbi:MAG: hypothetical protein FWH36_01745 [Lentimicrobiaceae bacterium]|nr:hypothetical protein [Lentimicrobiaceae bacterium]